MDDETKRKISQLSREVDGLQDMVGTLRVKLNQLHTDISRLERKIIDDVYDTTQSLEGKCDDLERKIDGVKHERS